MASRQSDGPARALTREALDALLNWLDPDDVRAGHQYERLRERLTRYFEWRACDRADMLADEVLDRVARRLAEGVHVEAADPKSYIYGVARLVCLEALKRQKKHQAALEQFRQAPQPTDAAELEGLDRLLRRCLDSLGPRSHALVLRYYATDGQARIPARQQLAAELGVPINALRIRMHRLRERLAECLAREHQPRRGPGTDET